MAEDLRRWLSGEPITARRVSPAERFARWCRRNPVVAGLSATAAVLLLVVAIVSITAYAKTSRALASVVRAAEGADAGPSGVAAAGGDWPSAVAD